MRVGLISRTQMCTALAVLGISFSPGELDALFQSFASEDGRFCYNDCAEAVEQTISKTKAGAVGGAGAAAARAIRKKGSIQTDKIIDKDEEELLDQVEEAMAARLLSQRLDLFPIFEDLASDKWAMPGHVKEGQFIAAMKNLAFPELTPQALNTLLEKYCDTELGNEFNHIEFYKSIEKRQAKKTFMVSRFDLSDTLKEKAASGCELNDSNNGPEWGNPYFDRLGDVRPCGSRPGSAAPSRPQSCRPFSRGPRPDSACSKLGSKRANYGQDAVPAGWRPGAGMSGTYSSSWFG